MKKTFFTCCIVLFFTGVCIVLAQERIAFVDVHNKSVKVYNAGRKRLAAFLLDNGASVAGYSSEIIVAQKGDYLKVYNAEGRNIQNFHIDNGAAVESVLGNQVTTLKHNYLKVYDGITGRKISGGFIKRGHR